MRRLMSAEAAAALARGEVLTETSEGENEEEEEEESSAISDDDDGPPALERAGPPNAALQRQQQQPHQGKQEGNGPIYLRR